MACLENAYAEGAESGELHGGRAVLGGSPSGPPHEHSMSDAAIRTLVWPPGPRVGRTIATPLLQTAVLSIHIEIVKNKK